MMLDKVTDEVLPPPNTCAAPEEEDEIVPEAGLIICNLL